MSAQRKVIQIATMPESVTTPPCLYVLCDDGTMWSIGTSGRWLAVMNVPQPEHAND